MIAAIASAALIVAASLVVGQGILTVCGRREWSWLAGPVGLAALLIACGIAAGLDAGATTIAISLLLLVLAAGPQHGGDGMGSGDAPPESLD